MPHRKRELFFDGIGGGFHVDVHILQIIVLHLSVPLIAVPAHGFVQSGVDGIQQVLPGVDVDTEGDLLLQWLVIGETGVLAIRFKHSQPGKYLRLWGKDLIDGGIAVWRQ